MRCFGSTRSQVRILSPRLNQIQVILESFPESLFYCQHLERWDWARFERDSAIPCNTLLPDLAQSDNDIHKIFPIILIIRKNIITMKSLFSSKRSKAILGIGLIAISIGVISKKVIRYPTGGCMKGTQELTLNKGIKKYFI